MEYLSAHSLECDVVVGLRHRNMQLSIESTRLEVGERVRSIKTVLHNDSQCQVTVALTENRGQFFLLYMRDSVMDMFTRRTVPDSNLFAGAESMLFLNGPRLAIHYGDTLRVISIENIVNGACPLLPILSLPFLPGTAVYSLHRTASYVSCGSTEYAIVHFLATGKDPEHVWLPIDHCALERHDVSEPSCAMTNSAVWGFDCEHTPTFGMATGGENLLFSVNVPCIPPEHISTSSALCFTYCDVDERLTEVAAVYTYLPAVNGAALPHPIIAKSVAGRIICERSVRSIAGPDVETVAPSGLGLVTLPGRNGVVILEIAELKSLFVISTADFSVLGEVCDVGLWTLGCGIHALFGSILFLRNGDFDSLVKGCAIEVEGVGSGGVSPRTVSTTERTVSNHYSKEKLELYFGCRICFEQLQDVPDFPVIIHCSDFSDAGHSVPPDPGNLIGKNHLRRARSTEAGPYIYEGLHRKKRRKGKNKSVSSRESRSGTSVECAMATFVCRLRERITAMCSRINDKVRFVAALQEINFLVLRRSLKGKVSTFSPIFRSLNKVYGEEDVSISSNDMHCSFQSSSSILVTNACYQVFNREKNTIVIYLEITNLSTATAVVGVELRGASTEGLMSFSRSSVLPILRAGSSCWVAMSARFIELLPPARDHRRWNTYGCSLSTHRQNNHTLRAHGDAVLTMFVDPDIFTRRTARERTSFCLIKDAAISVLASTGEIDSYKSQTANSHCTGQVSFSRQLVLQLNLSHQRGCRGTISPGQLERSLSRSGLRVMMCDPTVRGSVGECLLFIRGFELNSEHVGCAKKDLHQIVLRCMDTPLDMATVSALCAWFQKDLGLRIEITGHASLCGEEASHICRSNHATILCFAKYTALHLLRELSALSELWRSQCMTAWSCSSGVPSAAFNKEMIHVVSACIFCDSILLDLIVSMNSL